MFCSQICGSDQGSKVAGAEPQSQKPFGLYGLHKKYFSDLSVKQQNWVNAYLFGL